MTTYKYLAGLEPHQFVCEVEVTARLKYLPNTPCGVVKTEGGRIVLRAYNHYLLSLTPDGYIISFGKYPAYCGQIISAFMREYTPHIKYNRIKKQLQYTDPIFIGTRELATV